MLHQVHFGWGRSSVGTASDHHATDAGSIPQCGKDFSPRVNIQCRLSYSVRTASYPHVRSHLLTFVHVKDSIVCVRVQWIMETLKHPARTIGWVVWLSQLAFPGIIQL